MPLETLIQEIGDSDKRLSTTQLANLSHMDVDDTRVLTEAWPDFEVNRRFAIVQDMIELAHDNVDLNFDSVFKIALTDDEATVRAAALRGLIEYERRDLIPVLIDLLLTDEDADVRREAAIVLGRFALACELGQFGAEEERRVRQALIESAEDTEEDERVRARAIEALGALSGDDTENLIESIYDEDSLWLKVGAVDAMGRSANAMWVPVVLRETAMKVRGHGFTTLRSTADSLKVVAIREWLFAELEQTRAWWESFVGAESTEAINSA